jgi:hypothetical protein
VFFLSHWAPQNPFKGMDCLKKQQQQQQQQQEQQQQQQQEEQTNENKNISVI